ncbi:MAG TPA: hypothetical protein VGJ76_11250 [Pseudolabrys sp.]|jgi:hypothetical protein
MAKKLWIQMSQDEKLDHLHDRMLVVEVETKRISDVLGENLMRIDSLIDRILGKKKSAKR